LGVTHADVIHGIGSARGVCQRGLDKIKCAVLDSPHSAGSNKRRDCRRVMLVHKIGDNLNRVITDCFYLLRGPHLNLSIAALCGCLCVLVSFDSVEITLINQGMFGVIDQAVVFCTSPEITLPIVWLDFAPLTV
jgi:hypothetical protein